MLYLQYQMKGMSLFWGSIKKSYSTIKSEITFTESFKSALTKKLASKSKDSFLRLSISSGQGCEGYAYKFNFDEKLTEEDYVWHLQEKKVGFAVNRQQLRLINGSTIDYITQMMKQAFYVKENPNAELSCSCKTSFSPKDSLF